MFVQRDLLQLSLSYERFWTRNRSLLVREGATVLSLRRVPRTV
jgi:hypothetical protein